MTIMWQIPTGGLVLLGLLSLLAIWSGEDSGQVSARTIAKEDPSHRRDVEKEFELLRWGHFTISMIVLIIGAGVAAYTNDLTLVAVAIEVFLISIVWRACYGYGRNSQLPAEKRTPINWLPI